ncbi:MAG TPA: GNAT family N-acetyltransferase [Thermoplasmata archaeon]|nr:GNAT family N-acetyltransferase [Thermoplasmata archaeon]
MTKPPQPPGSPRAPALLLRPVRWSEDLDTVRRLFREYRQWLADHQDPSPESRERVTNGLAMVDSLIENLPQSYRPPRGDILLWFESGNLVACGALRELEPGIAEFRRIHVRPDHRGTEFGRPFVLALIARARELRFARVRAEALPTMRAAIEFHEQLGFHRIPAYWPHPAAGTIFFEREVEIPADLDASPARRRSA